jgi:thiol-disulfide isomerase/thioredoxin
MSLLSRVVSLYKAYFNSYLFQFWFWVAGAGLFSINAISATLKDIPEAKSLQTEISVALKTGYPLLVFVSLDNCPFCKIAKNNYLMPLMNEQSVPIVQVNFRYTTPVLDWQGKTLSQDQLVKAWAVKVAPTVLFLGKDGREIAPRLVGGSTSDFYGSYLEERIRTAQTAISRDSGMK